jgi:hypothetical protein
MRRRTILSVIRTVIYAGVTIILALWHGEIKGNMDAALVGGMWGDYLTWLIWSVIELPEDLVHGSYEACLNILFGLLVYRMGNIDLTRDVTGEFTAVMFLAFLAVIAVKFFYLSVILVEKEFEDDE